MNFEVEYERKKYGTGSPANSYRVVIMNSGDELQVIFAFRPPTAGKSFDALSDAEVTRGRFWMSPRDAATLATALAKASAARTDQPLVFDVDESQAA